MQRSRNLNSTCRKHDGVLKYSRFLKSVFELLLIVTTRLHFIVFPRERSILGEFWSFSFFTESLRT